MPIRPLLDLRPLADETLISQLKSLVRRERAITIAVLLRLIEVERRGLHLRRYSSLFLYCVDRLGYSPSAAGRRIKSARCLRDFPRVYEMLLEGRLNLTTLCIVSRVLTKENEADLLPRVAGKAEKEVERIVAALSRPIHPREIIRPIRVCTAGAGSTAPRRDPSAGVSGVGVPGASASNANVASTDVSSASVSGMGASGVGVPTAKVSSEDAASLGVPNANLPNANVLNAANTCADAPSAQSSGGMDVTTSDGIDVTTSGVNGTTSNSNATTVGARVAGSRGDSSVPVAGAPGTLPQGKVDASGAEATLSYRIAITVDGAFMGKLERARALVSRSRPGVSVADVFSRALDEFLKQHDPEQRMARRQQRAEKKEAATRGNQVVDVLLNGASDIHGGVSSSVSGDVSRGVSGDVSRSASSNVSRSIDEDARCNVARILTGDVSGGTPQVALPVDPAVDPATDPAVDSAADRAADASAPRASQRLDLEQQRETPSPSSDSTMHREEAPRGTGGSSDPGHITAAMRDAVWVRDGGRCTFVGPEGRCPETRGLQINHREPRSLGGVAELWNIELMCGAHNQSEADRVLGKDFMDLRRRRTPAPGVAAPEGVRSTSGDVLRRQTKHVESPEGTDANRASA